MSFALAVLAGAITGALSSWGIGGGTLLVLYMSSFTDMRQQTAQGINLLYFLPTAIAALVSHVKNRLVEWRAVIPSVIAGVPTAVLTSLLAVRVETDALRRVFGAFVIAVGVFEMLARDKQR